MPCRRHDPAVNSELANTTAGNQRRRRLNDLAWFSTRDDERAVGRALARTPPEPAHSDGIAYHGAAMILIPFCRVTVFRVALRRRQPHWHTSCKHGAC